MLKKRMAACLLATAVAGPAFAQSPATPSTDRPAATGTQSTTSGSPAMAPGGSMSAAPGAAATSALPGSAGPASGPSGSGSAPSQGQFVAQQQQGQWLASKLIGTRVVSANNETIGDVNDVLLDRGGMAQAIVIGVGGFLGIGEKDVAVPFSALELASSRDTNATGSTGSSSTRGTDGGTRASTSAASGATASVSAARNGGDIDRIVLRLTRADLQAAPTFERSRSSPMANAGTDRPGASSNAPASAGPAASRP